MIDFDGDITHQPDFEILINGKDKTVLYQEKFMSLTLRDVRGFEADQLDIMLDDSENDLTLPPEGTELHLKIGYKNKLVNKGTFTIDEVAHDGPPDVLTIRARSANLKTLKEQRIRTWDDVTIDDVIKTIAAKHNLKSGVSDSLASRLIKHEDQTNESDAHFLTRLAKLHDAIASVKNNTLLFIRAGDSKTASGSALEKITLYREDGDQHNYSSSERTGKYTGVKANWYDSDEAKAYGELVGEEGTVKTLRRVYSTKEEAWQAADAEFRKIGRGAASMSLTLAEGKPDMIPESPVELVDWKKEIIEQAWIVKEITHSINEQGLTSGIELETK